MPDTLQEYPTAKHMSIDDDVEATIWGKDDRFIKVDLSDWDLPPETLAAVLAESTGCRVSVTFRKHITVDPK